MECNFQRNTKYAMTLKAINMPNNDNASTQ